MKLTDVGPKREATDQTMAGVFSNFFRQREIPEPSGPKIMVAESTGEEIQSWYKKLGWGRMWSQAYGYPYEGECWGMDNGAWHAYVNGKEFPDSRFLKRVLEAKRRAAKVNTPPTVACVPDIVGEGEKSLECSLAWLPLLRYKAPEFDWYLAYQDGMTKEAVKDVLGEFDGLFLGGGDRGKARAREWCNLTHEMGKKFHFARCGTEARLTLAYDIGADSLDTAGPMMHPSQLRKFLRNYYILTMELNKGQDE
jgi:hypothetical protein